MSANSDRLVRLPPYQLLDAWRGLAALWVTLLHALLMGVLLSGSEPGTDPISALVMKGQLGVTIFFVISGYCIANAAASARGRPRPLRSFLAARVRRIYPPYYFSVALCVASLIAASALLGPAWTHSDQARSILGRGPLFYLATFTLTQTPLDQPLLTVIYWSLCYEVAFYAIVAAMMGLTRRGSDAVPLLYGLHILTIACLAWRISGVHCPFPLDLWPQFGLGILAFHVASAADKRGPVALLAVASAMAVAFALIRGVGGELAHPSPRLSFLFSVAYTFVLVGLRGLDAAISRRAVVRWLAWVGAFSYSLYLTHTLVLAPISKLARRLLGAARPPRRAARPGPGRGLAVVFAPDLLRLVRAAVHPVGVGAAEAGGRGRGPGRRPRGHILSGSAEAGEVRREDGKVGKAESGKQRTESGRQRTESEKRTRRRGAGSSPPRPPCFPHSALRPSNFAILLGGPALRFTSPGGVPTVEGGMSGEDRPASSTGPESTEVRRQWHRHSSPGGPRSSTPTATGNRCPTTPCNSAGS